MIEILLINIPSLINSDSLLGNKMIWNLEKCSIQYHL